MMSHFMVSLKLEQEQDRASLAVQMILCVLPPRDHQTDADNIIADTD